MTQPNGKQYPLRLKVRTPTPDDLVKANENGTVPQREDENLFNSVPKEDAEKLDKRLPTIETKKEDEQDFFKRDETVKPPETTEKIQLQTFPPKESFEPPKIEKETEEEEKELIVERYLPEGKIPMASYLSVTFNSPMIKLGTIEEIEKQKIPVELSPKCEGRWRWIGTKTLYFEPTFRFNKSTIYTAKISAETKSATGLKLEKDVIWSFETPTVKVTEFFPKSFTHENPVFYIHFDQNIKPEEVLKSISINSKLDQFEVVTQEEAEKIVELQNPKQRQSISYYLKSGVKDRFMWLKLKKKLKLSTHYSINIGPKTPSAEGPNVTDVAQHFSFSTYGKFFCSNHRPKDSKYNQPSTSWTVYFTNSIDEDVNPVEFVEISPELPNVRVVVSGASLVIFGNSKGKETYTLKIKTGLTDIYGQKLEEEVNIKFEISEASKSMESFYQGLIVIDPTENTSPTHNIITCNLSKFRCAIFQVDPKDYQKSHFGNNSHLIKDYKNYDMTDFCKFGKKVFDDTIVVKGIQEQKVETPIDIVPYLQHSKEKLGQLYVICEPLQEEWYPEEETQWMRRPIIHAWIQCTNLAVDAIINNSSCELTCWANNLKDGSNVDDAKFTFYGKTKSVDETGITHFDLPEDNVINLLWDCSLLIAKSKNDVSFINHIYKGYKYPEQHLHWTFDDRKLYKPKEKVNIKGFIRKLAKKKSSYHLEHDSKCDIIHWEAFDSMDISYKKGDVKITPNGSFQLSFDLPDNINLGEHYIMMKTSKDSFLSFFYGSECFSHNFKVEEFRTPEYKVNASASESSFVGDSSAILTVNSSYFSGGGLSGAKVDWTVSQTKSSYKPPGFSSFHFQKPNSSWYYQFDNYIDEVGEMKMKEETTDSNGENKICIEFTETDRYPKTPVTITGNVNVQDLSNQVMGSSTSFIVHPSSNYVGVKSKKNFVKPEETISLEIVVTSIKGLLEADVPINIIAIKKDQIVETKTIKKDVIKYDEITKSQNKPMTYDLSFKDPGLYNIEIEVTDKDGLKNSTGLFVVVSGGSQQSKSSRVVCDQLLMIADKESYEIGDTAQIYVQHPYDSKAEAIYTILLSGVHSQKRFTMTEGHSVLKIPICEEMIPGPTVYVEIVSSDYRLDFNLENLKDAPKKPAYASGSLYLSVPPLIHKLTAKVTPKNTVCRPGSENEVEVCVLDHEGKAVANSDVSLIVVDEAILSLTSYSIEDPLLLFYPGHSQGYTRNSIRSNIFVKDWSSLVQASKLEMLSMQIEETKNIMFSNIDKLMERGERIDSLQNQSMLLEDESFSFRTEASSMSIPTSGGMPRGDAPKKTISKPITARTNFNPLAAFSSGITDKSGKVKLKFKLPDNLTEYRVTAVLTHKFTSFGIGESSIVANLPLSIRPSAPRFLNFGDQCSFPVILQNQSTETIDVNFTIKLTNLKLQSPEKFEYLNVTIPSKNRVVIKYPIETTHAGIGRFQIGAEVLGTEHADAITKEFPIFTPSTSEAFATYGEIDNGSFIQPISKPPNVFPQYGGVEVTTSSTAVQALTDSFIYLYSYKFECVEQIASKILSIVALENVLYAFSSPGIPSKSTLKSYVAKGIKKLQNNQRPDGSYGFWTSKSEPNIFLTIHVAHCFQRCIDQGYEIPSNTFQKSKTFLINIERYLENETTMAKSTKYSLRLFALYVLTLMKYDKIQIYEKAKKIYDLTENPSLDSIAWLLVSFNYADPTEKLIPILLKKISQTVIETPETASFSTSKYENNDAQLVMLHSNQRTDAIIMDSLIEVEPKNTLIPKIVKGLMKKRVNGRWGSTSENCYVLLAMKKYFEIYEKEEPDFLLKLWCGDTNSFIGEQKFKGRSTEKNLIEIPMKYISENLNDNLDLLLNKEGKGRLYYRIGMSYSPKDFHLEALDYGFIVERTYEHVSNEKDVVQNKDGSWRFQEGCLVKVKLKMTNTSYRYHVALVDYLPAGLEALNPDLPIGGSQNKSTDSSNKINSFSWWWYYSTWYNHQNIRDERVESFATYLYPSVHSYSYLARATTKGKFIAPPAKAEEMYSPEVFGRSKSEIVDVVEVDPRDDQIALENIQEIFLESENIIQDLEDFCQGNTVYHDFEFKVLRFYELLTKQLCILDIIQGSRFVQEKRSECVLNILNSLKTVDHLKIPYINRGNNGNTSCCTAESQIKGVSLKNKVVIITGSNTGIGLETARVLAKIGAHVIISARNVEKLKDAKSYIEKNVQDAKIDYIPIDLGSSESINNFVEKFKKMNLPLHYLINNAGVMMNPTRETTKDGFEYQIGINHLGHFKLTMLLLPIMKKSDGERRIVVLSSDAHKFGSQKINFDDFLWENSYNRLGSYGQSKLANILFSNELNDLLKSDSIPITVNSLHPGVIPGTELTRDFPWIIRIGSFLFLPFLQLFMKSVEQGAATTIFAVVSKELQDKGGLYLENSHISKAIDYAYNKEEAKKLWKLSEELTGVSY
eukprot:gene7433-11756_t